MPGQERHTHIRVIFSHTHSQAKFSFRHAILTHPKRFLETRGSEPGQTRDPTGEVGQNSTMQAERRASREAPPRCSVAEAYYALEHVREAVVTLCPTSRWLELAANAYPCMSSFVDIGSNKGHTGASFFGLWAREASGLRGVHHWWQLAYDNSSHRRATVDTVGIAWRLIVHDRSIARRTRLGLLQRSCTLSRSTASMEFGHTYRLGAYTPTRERREMKSTAQLSTLSQPPVRPFEGTGSHHLGIPSVHLMRPSNTRSTKVAQLSAPERSEASPT